MSSEIQEFVPDEQIQSIVESVLFASTDPVPFQAFKAVFLGTPVTMAQIRRALDQISVELASGHHGICVEQVAGGYQLRTKIDNVKFLRRMVKGRGFRLSAPALETLAILAYKQPVIKSEIDQIRGVESGHLLRALMEKSLVRFCGKSELPGKPMLYSTTRKFLEIFGLRSIQELPSLREIDELLPDGIKPETARDDHDELGELTEKLSVSSKKTYSEQEQDLENITDQLASISTTTAFFEQEKMNRKKEMQAAHPMESESGPFNEHSKE